MSETSTAPDIDPQEINAHHIESEFDTPDVIYVDLCLIRDYQFGCLFTFIQEHPPEIAERLYAHLIAKWPERQRSHFDTITSFFPELKITQKAFDERLHDPQWSDRIFIASPMTVYPHVLKAQLTINVNHSQVSEKFTKIKISQHQYIKNYDRVVYMINTWPLTLSKESQDQTAAFFRDNFLVDVVMINQSPDKFSTELFLQVDHFHIRYLKQFIENTHIQKLLSESVYIKKKLFAAPFFAIENHREYPPKRMDSELAYLNARLNVSFTFSWIPNNLCCVMQDAFEMTAEETDDGGRADNKHAS